jgi:hypothetical protein
MVVVFSCRGVPRNTADIVAEVLRASSFVVGLRCVRARDDGAVVAAVQPACGAL